MKRSLIVLFSLISIGLLSQDTIKKGYPKNEIAFHAIVANNFGVGSGVSYERFINKKNNISVNLPFHLHYFWNEFDWDFHIGMRYYFRTKKRIQPFVGLSINYGVENWVNSYYASGIWTYYPIYRRQLGPCVNIGFKKPLTKRINLIGEGSLGYALYDQHNISGYLGKSEHIIGGINFGLGYNF
jgi:hypothetical protein